MNTPEPFVQRVAVVMAKRGIRTKQEMAELLGISRTQLYYLEKPESEGGKLPPLRVHEKMNDLEREVGIYNEQAVHSCDDDQPAPKGIPIISWAHAGEATSYDELPKSWQDFLDYQVSDPLAFAVRLRGDSMGKEYIDDDVLVLTPSVPISSGCLAVLKLANDGILFRTIETRPGFLRLVPKNERYPVEEIPLDQIQWVYRMSAMIRVPAVA